MRQRDETTWRVSLLSRLEFLYGKEKAGRVAIEIDKLTDRYRKIVKPIDAPRWSEQDALLITYGDTLTLDGMTPLAALKDFLKRDVPDLFTFVHLLPFYPWTSDDGFAVTDFRQVNPSCGDWSDVAALSGEWKPVFDGVINHVSSTGTYMKGYGSGDPAYADFFLALAPDTDTRSVLRTRNLPLLHAFDTVHGKKWLWTTFGPDQVDLNFQNPAVLLEILDVLLFYAAKGARMIRLDAIPYLWKRLGTSCAHLPETHAIIKLIRDVLDRVAPQILLLSETNAPWSDNVRYLGDNGDEAQILYHFNLPPLILYALLKGDAAELTRHARALPPMPPGTTLLNITATHDGIGMRATEGVLTEEARRELTDLAVARGGAVTGKRNADGSVSPYELNLNYFDALNDPLGDEPLELQIRRFFVSQLITLAFAGIPGIYIQSLLCSRSNFDGVKETGRARTINRAVWSLKGLREEFRTPGSLRNRVLGEFQKALRLRRTIALFHPDVPQEIPELSNSLFVIRRFETDGKDEIFALHNVTRGLVNVDLQDRVAGQVYVDLLTGKSYPKRELSYLMLDPYQCLWLKRMS